MSITIERHVINEVSDIKTLLLLQTIKDLMTELCPLENAWCDQPGLFNSASEPASAPDNPYELAA